MSGELRRQNDSHADLKIIGRRVVPSVPLTTLLERHEIEQVDVLSIDTEGTELAAWRTLDLTHWRPCVAIIELDACGLPSQSKAIKEQMACDGFELLHETKHNGIFRTCNCMLRCNPPWDKMNEQAVVAYMRPPGVTSQGLQDLCSTFISPGMSVAEIGSFAGASARIFAKAVTSTGSVVCVDPWEGCWGRGNYVADHICEQVFDLFAQHAPHVRKLKMRSLVAANEIPDHSLDLVYIDGSHKYEDVRADCAAWLPKLKPGGILAGHDFGWSGVARAVTELFGQPFQTFADMSWAVVV